MADELITIAARSATTPTATPEGWQQLESAKTGVAQPNQSAAVSRDITTQATNDRRPAASKATPPAEQEPLRSRSAVAAKAPSLGWSSRNAGKQLSRSTRSNALPVDDHIVSIKSTGGRRVCAKSGHNGVSPATTTVSSFLVGRYIASDKVLLKLVQSLGRSLHARKRDRQETSKRRSCSSWLRHVPGCCSGLRKSASPPTSDLARAIGRLHPEVPSNGSDRTALPPGRYSRARSAEQDISRERRLQPDPLEPAVGSTIERCAGDVRVAATDECRSNLTTCGRSFTGEHDNDDHDDLDNDAQSDPQRVPCERTYLPLVTGSERNMGANVSSSARQHAKGLASGRRAQSIDNLKSETTQYFHQYHNNNNHGETFHQQTFLGFDGGEESCGLRSAAGGGDSGEATEKQPPPPDLACSGAGEVLPTPDEHQRGQQQHHIVYVSQKDRNKFCGSLPNHLDLDVPSGDRDCEAIVKQNEFLQANLKHVQQHEQQQAVQHPSSSEPQQQHFTHQLATYHHYSHQQQQQHGSPATLSLGGGSLVGVGSTFRSNTTEPGANQQQYQHPHQHHLQLKLPLHRTAVDAGCDQGYGSERSPEDELPPPLPLLHEGMSGAPVPSPGERERVLVGAGGIPAASGESAPAPLPAGQQACCLTQGAANSDATGQPYSFITKDCTFYVQVQKGTRGLGLSVSGGSDSSAPYPGLIRVKRIFPHQAAWATGMLHPGDILLDANGVPLTGLTNCHALEVLRSITNVVTLTVCRPKDEQYRKLSPPTEPPRPPLRNALSYESGSRSVPQSSFHMSKHRVYQQQMQQHQQYHAHHNAGVGTNEGEQVLPTHAIDHSFKGEFEIVMSKQQGSLGFTLRKEEQSRPGHYVQALVREPALSDWRIEPGDRILAVNDVPISAMSHEDAVVFLRQAADVVLLRLYRDQTVLAPPCSAQSPTGSSCSAAAAAAGPGNASVHFALTDCPAQRPRVSLRPEARNLLTDLAANRQQQLLRDTAACASGGSSVASSGRTSLRRFRRLGVVHHHQANDNQSRHEQRQRSQQHSNETFSSSDSCSNASTTISRAVDHQDDSYYYCDEEIDAMVNAEEDNDCPTGGQSSANQQPRPRPTFLDLAASGHDASPGRCSGLINLDRATLDASLRSVGTTGLLGNVPIGDVDAPNFASLPCETFLVACKTEQDLQTGDDARTIYVQHFAHKSPLYSSVNDPAKSGAPELVDTVEQGGKTSLMKWKGATLLTDAGRDLPAPAGCDTTETPGMVADPGSALDACLAATAGTMSLSTATPTTERELFDFNANYGTDSEGNQIFTVELNKGWNSRLGFSLKQEQTEGGTDGCIRTVISAIHSDSLAARDGRLRLGDVVMSVNEESVRNIPTTKVIELMRIVRGTVFITLLRPGEASAGDRPAEMLPGPGSTLEPTPEEQKHDASEPLAEPNSELVPTSGEKNAIDEPQADEANVVGGCKS